jgi:DNA mismatch repair protein MutL
MSIKILDSQVISQIAAGEVVERPASIAKELIENSLDAGATQISVEIKGGGISFIRVTDNGSGIRGEDSEIAFERHATSKIENIHDLQILSTLGFRGEALPSIASVAQVQLITCEKSESSGTCLSIEEGKVIRHETQARSPGTTITVQNLFRKIPARLKFLKTESSEASRIADIVSRYALAYSEIKFTFSNEGRVTLRTSGTGKLLDSLIAVYGLEIAQNMLEVNNQISGWSDSRPEIIVTGLVGSPKIARATRDHITFFVNRRWINSRMLNIAVEEAYHGLLMQGKHPLTILNITIAPDRIDVNVHPSKTEIKFQDEHSVFSAVQKAVRQSLVQTAPVHQVEEIKPRFGFPSVPFSSHGVPDRSIMGGHSLSSASSSALSPTPLISLPLLRVIGQIAGNYIIAEGPDGLFIIDQHAAHERIQLEKIRNQRSNSRIEVQGLLEPVTFEVEPGQTAILNNHLQEFSAFGFNIEPFGDKTFILRAIPSLLRDKDWKSFLKEVLDTQTGNWIESLSITLACHTAIRAGQILSDIEMRELIKQLEQTTLPNSCPHGRPTMIHLTVQQIEKEFGRT